jgi:hypothetical protein
MEYIMLSKALTVVKENPWKITLGTVGTIVFSIIGVFFSDARYAFKDDVKLSNTEVQQQIMNLQQQIDKINSK